MEGSARTAVPALEPRGSGLRSLPRHLSLVLSAVWAGFIGLLPHALHHAGPLAGAALFAGAGGSILFGAIGLVVAIPFLLRLRRGTGGWRVPGGALALMVAMFSISTVVIGPKISGSEGTSNSDQAAPAKTAPVPGSPTVGEGPTGSEATPAGGHEAHH